MQHAGDEGLVGDALFHGDGLQGEQVAGAEADVDASVLLHGRAGRGLEASDLFVEI